MELRDGRVDVAAVAALVEKVAVADGVDPLSEHKAIELAKDRGRGVTLWEGGELIAYAHVSEYDTHRAVELVVSYSHRTDAVVTALLDGIAAGTELQVWAWLPWLVDLLERHGWESVRRLFQLRRPLPPDVRPRLPAGIEVRPFRVGVDEDAWIEANNAVFAGHPEQGGWDRAELAERMQQEWFDPADVHLAWEQSRIVGFCWTKVHRAEHIGEIYVIGIHPDYRGRSLGTELTLVGLWHLYDVDGVETGMLYVDDVNPWAIRMYEHLGFEPHHLNQAFVQPNL